MQSASQIDLPDPQDIAAFYRDDELRRRGLAREAVSRRDILAALDAMRVDCQHCFVWPETYPQTYHYQRLSWCKGVDGFPVVMKAARTSIYAKHTKGEYCIRVAERFLRRYKVTEISNGREAVRKLLRVICKKHEANEFAPRILGFLGQFNGSVLVDGRPIPIDPERLRILEKSIALVEKIDRISIQMNDG